MAAHARSQIGASPSSRPANPYILCICVALLHLSSSVLFAQTRELRFERITLESSLTSYRAFDIAQDSIGFLWFATGEGLYRYDGLTTTSFKPRLGDTSATASITIWTILTDRSGRLWIGTFDAGLDCYDPGTERFSHFRREFADDSTGNPGPITALLEDRHGALWIGTERSGLARLDQTRRQFTWFRHQAEDSTSLSDNSVKAICEDTNGALWIGTASGLNTLEPGGMAFRIFRHNPGDRSSLSGDHITCLWSDEEGSIWAGTKSQGLNRVDARTGRSVRFRSKTKDHRSTLCDSVTSLFRTHPDYLWVGTVCGLQRFTTETGRVQSFQHDPFNTSSLSSNWVRAIKADRTGTLWVATDIDDNESNLHCINKLDKKSEQFRYFRLRRTGGGALAVTAILHDPKSKTTWIGTEGLRALHRPTGRIVEYIHDPANEHSLSDDYISSLYRDRSGALWVGTWGGGLNRFVPSTSSFDRYQWKTPGGELGGNALCLCEDIPPEGTHPSAAGNLWIGTFSEGVLEFSRSKGIVGRHTYNPGDAGSLGSDRILAMLVDRSGTLWVGTDGGGLNRFDRSTGKFRRFGHDVRNPSSLRSSRILFLLEDPSSRAGEETVLWVGTATGLDKFYTKQGVAVHVVLRDSAEAIGVLGLALRGEDLWASTAANGLYRLSLRSGACRVFGEHSGLPSNAFTRACFASPDGEMFLGQYSGFIKFRPEEIIDNPAAPNVVLTGFNVFDTPYRTPEPLWTAPLISLKYGQHFFSFRFAALEFTDPANNMFAYKLEGLDEDWRHPGTRNYAGYTDVEPGEYVFRVMAANSDGVWNRSGASITLRIDPPYWATWWFRGLVILTALGFLVGAYEYRIAQIRKVERLRLDIASDLHDDIGSRLSGIALMTDSLKSKVQLGERDREHLAEVSQVARHTADALRDIVWLVNPEHDTADDLLLRMKDATAILPDIEYSIEATGASLSHKMSLEFRHNLILIYKEILNNIAKHSRAQHVIIRIDQKDEDLSLQIADDGVGFDPDSVARGNGLNNLRRRAEMIDGALTLQSAPGQGTVVTLKTRIS